MNIITVTDLANFAPEIDTSRYTAVTISGMISQASQIVADILGYQPYAEDVVDEVIEARVDTQGDLLIFPAKIPVQSLSALGIKKGASEVAIGVTNSDGDAKYNIDYTKRHIRYPYGELTLSGVPIFTDFYNLRSTQFYVKLSYRGGWEVSDLPSSIQRACILIMQDILSSRYNQVGAHEVSQGGISFSWAPGAKESVLMQQAKKLLNPYIR